MKRYSIIIISREQSDASAALQSIGRLQYPAEKMEVIQACGRSPSKQRNEAAKLASGELLLFLDEDSQVHPKLLQYYDDALLYEPDIGVVGGPSLFESEEVDFRSAVQAFFSSAFGMGPFRSRYCSLGIVRKSNERELILCNMLIRRSLFLQEGGFHLELYPNEENEFLNRVQKKTKIYYHPQAVCHRSPPDKLLDFCRQMLRYGSGRAKHLLLFPRFWNHIFLLPAIFFIYTLLLPILLIYCSNKLYPVLLFPLAIYGILALTTALSAAQLQKNRKLFVLLPPILFVGHFFYGLGIFTEIAIHPFQQKLDVNKVEVYICHESAWQT